MVAQSVSFYFIDSSLSISFSLTQGYNRPSELEATNVCLSSLNCLINVDCRVSHRSISRWILLKSTESKTCFNRWIDQSTHPQLERSRFITESCSLQVQLFIWSQWNCFGLRFNGENIRKICARVNRMLGIAHVRTRSLMFLCEPPKVGDFFCRK